MMSAEETFFTFFYFSGKEGTWLFFFSVGFKFGTWCCSVVICP